MDTTTRDHHEIVVEVRYDSEQRFLRYAVDVAVSCDFLDVETSEEAMEEIRRMIMEDPEQSHGEYMEFVSGLAENQVAELKEELELRARRRFTETLGKVPMTQGAFGELVATGRAIQNREQDQTSGESV